MVKVIWDKQKVRIGWTNIAGFGGRAIPFKKKHRALDRERAGAYNRGEVLVKGNTDFGEEGKVENKFSTSPFVAFAAETAAILLRKTTPKRGERKPSRGRRLWS